MNSRKPLCTVPFTKLFVLTDGTYRDCCASFPETLSRPGESVVDWWNSDQLAGIRKSMWSTEFPLACQNCEAQEHIHNSSFRLSASKEIDTLAEHYKTPDTWHIMFGNKCNLACWICDEKSSSLIAHHKQRIDILPVNFVNPNDEFTRKWPDLKANILDSYNHHDTVRICILGGEPIYNKDVIEFLEYLIAQGLSNRTILEFTTNGTILGKTLLKLFDRSQWKYICIFVSVDAIGPVAEWIRYGSNWSAIADNIMHYRDTVNYVEIQTTLSILNLMALPDVVDFCKAHDLAQTISMLSDPEFMDIRKWDGNISAINQQPFVDRNLHSYIDLIGSNKQPGMSDRLTAYIQQFSLVRRPLVDFDPALASFLGVQ
jgi:organic radical activating enzyme